MAVPFLACMAAAAAFYNLPPRVLPSIAAVEGGRVGMVHHNADGTDDFGVMQVNTIWVGPLSRFARMTPAAVRSRLTGDACFNIAAGAIILRTYLNEAHGNLMTAVGDYHSHTPGLNMTYRVLVVREAMALFRPVAAVQATQRPDAGPAHSARRPHPSCQVARSSQPGRASAGHCSGDARGRR